jgi:hypothetical protein
MPTTTGKIYLGSTLVAGGASGSPDGTWTRPSGWLDLPDFSSSQGFVGLHAVFEHGANFVAFSAEAAYTVDWGDGNAPTNYASGVTAEKNLVFTDYDASTTTARNFRQAIIKVTPQSGQNITKLDLRVAHSQSGLNTAYRSGWLDITVNGPNLASGTNLIIGGTARPFHGILERVTILSIGAVTNLSALFQNCDALRSVPPLNMGAVTIATSMFNGCSSLKVAPLLDVSAPANMNQMFRACSDMIFPPDLDMTNVTSMPQTFLGCTSLQEIPAYNLANVTTGLANAFSTCPSLARVRATGIDISVSFANCKLSGAALDEIYTNLSSTGSGKTITVTGNYGTATHDPTIATGKGWTVTA